MIEKQYMSVFVVLHSTFVKIVSVMTFAMKYINDVSEKTAGLRYVKNIPDKLPN